MKILFVNNIYPLFERGDSGASNRSTMFINALASMGHVDLISFLPDEQTNVSGCDVVYSKDCPSPKNKGRFGKLEMILEPWNINALFPLNRLKEEIIDRFVQHNNYDLIAVRYINEAAECGLLKYANKLLLDLDDNPYKASINAAQTARSLRNRIYSYVYALELKRHVEKTARRVFRVFHSNPAEKPVDNSIYLHNVAMYDNPRPDIVRNTPLQLLVIGTWHYAPNRDGIRHFLSRIYPKVIKALPNINLRVVGRIHDEAFRQELSKEKNVTLVGYVQDLSQEYENVRMAIVPIYSGSGTSIKFLEALCINRACISTAQGARGMEDILTPDKDYLFAENDEQFSSKIINTITDVDKCNALSHSALDVVKEHLSKEHFMEIVKNSL